MMKILQRESVSGGVGNFNALEIQQESIGASDQSSSMNPKASIKNSTLKLFKRNMESNSSNATPNMGQIKGNNEQFNNAGSGTGSFGNTPINAQQGGGASISNFQGQRTASIMSRLLQKSANMNTFNNIRQSKVNFDDKTTVNVFHKRDSLRRFDYSVDQIIQDPLVNVFPEGMPRKHILYKELLQAYFNGEITMNELIDLRNKYTMRKNRQVSIPLKDEEIKHDFDEKVNLKANARFWSQIRLLRQKQQNKAKSNEKKQRGSILLNFNTPTGMGMTRKDSFQSVLQSQNSFSQPTLTRVDTKVDLMMQQIDEKDENNKIEEEATAASSSNNPSNSNIIQKNTSPSMTGTTADQPKKITKFGYIIFDKLLNIKDKVEHKKILEMKQNKQNQNQFLTQFEEAQQEVIEKIKRGDLLQNDLSHKYYVKQFIERKNLNHLKILADKTGQIESLVTSKTVKKMNEDFKANKQKIFKEIEVAADEYLNKLQLKRTLLDQYSHNNSNKYDELEMLKNWRQSNSKRILKEQQEKHMSQYLFEKEQKELEQEQKKQRIIQSRMVRTSMDSISCINSKQENSTSVENIRNNYYSSSIAAPSRYSTFQGPINNMTNSTNANHSNLSNIVKKEKSSPSIITQQQQKNLAQIQAVSHGSHSIGNHRQTITIGNNNTLSLNQNTMGTNSILHVSRTSMTDYTPLLAPSATARKSNQLQSNSQKSTKYQTDMLSRKTTDGLAFPNKNQTGQQKYVEDYLNMNGTASTTATTSNSNKLNSLFLPSKANVKGGFYNSQQQNTGTLNMNNTDYNKKNHTKPSTTALNSNKKNTDNELLSKSEEGQTTTKENQKKVSQYLSNSKIIHEHNKQNKPAVFLKDIYDLYSQEELYRNNNELRMRSKMHVSDKENLQKFYKSEYDYKVIKRNAAFSDRQNSMSRIDADKSLNSLPNYEFNKGRVKSESNCLTGLLSSKQQLYNTVNTSSLNTQINLQMEDTLLDTNNNNNNNNLDDSQSGDSSLPSITEAQLDSLYSQSRHIQKMILKSKGNSQLFARRMKNVIKLKEINEGINKCIKMKLNHKTINN